MIYATKANELTCAANEKVIAQGNVQPAAWNIGKILEIVRKGQQAAQR